jgi:hypothetical protein
MKGSNPTEAMDALEAMGRFEAELADARRRRESRRPGKRSQAKRPRIARSPLGHATPEQRSRVADRACIVCGKHAGNCHPAHLIPRAASPSDSADDERMTVPLCPVCHPEYDEGQLDLLPHLEPYWRDAIIAAVEAVGLMAALKRITKRRWVPEEAV